MSYTIQHIAKLIQATAVLKQEANIEYLIIDSRKITFPSTSLFFALHTHIRNGHSFIAEVYERGLRNFVIDENIDTTAFPDANFLKVANSLIALQNIAIAHRKQFETLQVIGITGSNGKTIVKEWLNLLLQNDYNIVRSPRSYNSQIGVPLSIWQINSTHNLGIFEAGISTYNEMDKLEKIIQPTIGILTNIGNTHDEGFENKEHKFLEKIQLFKNCSVLIARENDCKIHNPVVPSEKFKPTVLTWGFSNNNEFVIQYINKQKDNATISFLYKNKEQQYIIPFTDEASIENAITCICVMLVLKFESQNIATKIALLQPVEMRMQLKKAINNCYVINDSYSNDIASLNIALDYLKQQSGNQTTTVILSDILQTGIPQNDLYKRVSAIINQKKVHKFIGIGEQLNKHKHLFENSIQQTAFYNSVEDFLLHTNTHHFKDEFILLKGARLFAFERINDWLAFKVHQTVLEINLSAMVHNLKTFQNHLQPGTKLMAMVKAFSYGSGSVEIARLLQFYKVDYLAVAYTDEGIELRKAGISLPIMIMNTDEAAFHAVVEYNLEPEIYSFNIYHTFHQYLLQQGITNFPVHLKLNTGMNRLGFDEQDIHTIATLLQQNNTMVVQSAFSHLTSSEEAADDDFTLHQSQVFLQYCNTLENKLGYKFIKHIANSAAALRKPFLQMDMIRLGIGLYGINNSKMQSVFIQPVATLKTTIAQIREVKKEDTVGYNRKGKLQRDSKIATIRIGYADGFKRSLSNGVGAVYVKGKFAKVVGSICMDMAMIDVTDIDEIQEEDEVEIFGTHISIEQVAQACNTISYEIMTSVSQRVKRVYMEE